MKGSVKNQSKTKIGQKVPYLCTKCEGIDQWKMAHNYYFWKYEKEKHKDNWKFFRNKYLAND